ncbi:MAG: 3-dehydroquinate synthase [Nitrospirota bacterium]
MDKMDIHNIEKIRVDLRDRTYSIEMGNVVLGDLGTRLRELNLSKKISIITNPTISNLYGKVVDEGLKRSGFEPIIITIPDGEEYKTLLWISHLYDELLTYRLDRRSAIIALGGGVIGDMAGFVAATYMRGIPYIQVPTTLLAQVDSSVGGKTGVNHILGKNMIGSFYQPGLVWIDIKTLETLPDRELRAGISEVIKYGMIADIEFFEYLEKKIENIISLDEPPLIHIIKRSCEIKAEVVSKDEREEGLRSTLNFGHTIGHAIETLTNYTTYKHGEAVALGMLYEAKIANRMGLCNKDILEKLKVLILRAGLPTKLPDISADKIIEAMQIDKKVREEKIRIVLPEEIGRVSLREIDNSIIQAVIEEKGTKE